MLLILCFLWINGFLLAQESQKGEVSLKKVDPSKVLISANGSFFAEYRTNCKGTPIVWPICSSDGLLMTRGYPMIDEENPDQIQCPEFKNILMNAKINRISEALDHPHHRSFWFNHGNVNGCDFWTRDRQASIVHDEFLALENNEKTALIKTKNKWIDEKTNKTLCTDIRTLVFGVLKVENRSIRYIDFDIEITATENEVVFGDTKEGSFGIRVPGTMDVDIMKRNKKFGNRNKNWGGKILNSNGEKDGITWAKRANWVDYSGPIPARLNDVQLSEFAKKENKQDLKLALGGITVMNHPGSFRFPTWWHVRTYGLYAANPFGQHDFEPGTGNGSQTLKKGEKLHFGYRVLFHDGDLDAKTLDRLYGDYAK